MRQVFKCAGLAARATSSHFTLVPEDRLRSGGNRGIIVVTQAIEETAHAAEGLADEQRGRAVTMHDSCLEIGVPSAQDTGRREELHRGIGDSLLNVLTVKD